MNDRPPFSAVAERVSQPPPVTTTSHRRTKGSERSDSTHDDGIWRAGDVAIINLMNGLENPGASGKRRPAVLIRRDCGHWVVMGLTTNPSYRNATPRTAVPDPRSVGLRGAGWLWGNRLANVSVLDIDHHLGHVDAALAEAIISLADLDQADAAALRVAASGPLLRTFR